jgi:hypothetical protein
MRSWPRRPLNAASDERAPTAVPEFTLDVTALAEPLRRIAAAMDGGIRKDRDFALVLLRHAVEHFTAPGAPQMLDARCEHCRAIYALVRGPINFVPGAAATLEPLNLDDDKEPRPR